MAEIQIDKYGVRSRDLEDGRTIYLVPLIFAWRVSIGKTGSLVFDNEW